MTCYLIALRVCVGACVRVWTGHAITFGHDTLLPLDMTHNYLWTGHNISFGTVWMCAHVCVCGRGQSVILRRKWTWIHPPRQYFFLLLGCHELLQPFLKSGKFMDVHA